LDFALYIEIVVTLVLLGAYLLVLRSPSLQVSLAVDYGLDVAGFNVPEPDLALQRRGGKLAPVHVESQRGDIGGVLENLSLGLSGVQVVDPDVFVPGAGGQSGGCWRVLQARDGPFVPGYHFHQTARLQREDVDVVGVEPAGSNYL